MRAVIWIAVILAATLGLMAFGGAEKLGFWPVLLAYVAAFVLSSLLCVLWDWYRNRKKR